MEQDKSLLGRAGTGLVYVLLWLGTAALGLWEILVIRDMVLRVYSRVFSDERAYGQDYWGGVALGNWLVLILGIVWMAMVIGLGEYYFRNIGEPKSWKWFGRVIAVQLAILVLALVI